MNCRPTDEASPEIQVLRVAILYSAEADCNLEDGRVIHTGVNCRYCFSLYLYPGNLCISVYRVRELSKIDEELVY